MAGDRQDIPLAITYLIAFLAALMRLRLQLYEMVLADSIERQARP